MARKSLVALVVSKSTPFIYYKCKSQYQNSTYDIAKLATSNTKENVSRFLGHTDGSCLGNGLQEENKTKVN